MMAGSPCVVGNLWNVSSCEIADFYTHILKKYLNLYEDPYTVENFEKTSSNICNNLIEARREMVKLSILNSFATVIYGMPLLIEKEK